MRSILRDRVSASAVALLLACLLLIQGLLIGAAQGAMAVPAADPAAICSSVGHGSVNDALHSNLPAKKAPECPCGTLCRLASAAMPAIVSGQAGPLYVAVETSIDAAIRVDEVVSLALRGRIAEPRAPPIMPDVVVVRLHAVA
ncbi:hypothetical protein QO004_004960 [Rhizobium mesoamericanum]|uniref:hypothetical protein n=1 Tax=Rhizobium mesoamericanum TaxID=1079800 RepID=UPI00277FCD4D|nr:hypothetical protein [Rhizobium mesoamericanum]MDQ0563151.1 hypothetical protein [Rhizobium mesoamericanum]